MLSFSQAITDANRYSKVHCLLGNGFSISCRPDIFLYSRLFERADFRNLSTSVGRAFEALGTQDFERVIKALKDCSALVSVYSSDSALSEALLMDANGLREVLVRTIAASHPAWPGDISDAEYSSCRRFLSNFSTVYTLNYDLLLYWAFMHDKDETSLKSDDGFRNHDYEDETGYVVWEAETSRQQNIWYLHGALHLFDSGVEVQKYTWVKTGQRLIDQIRSALEKDFYPLFVSEGTSAEKLERIRHSDYLAKAKRSFSAIGGALFIHGHSLAANDNHFLKAIEKGKISHLYIGLYGDEFSSGNKEIKRRADTMIANRAKSRPLSVTFYDSATAKVWDS